MAISIFTDWRDQHQAAAHSSGKIRGALSLTFCSVA